MTTRKNVPELPKSLAERVQEMRERPAEFGFVRLDLYAHLDDHERIKAYVARLVHKRERDIAKQAQLDELIAESQERRRKRGYLTEGEITAMYSRMTTAAVPVPARAMAAGGGTTITAVPADPCRASKDPEPQAPASDERKA